MREGIYVSFVGPWDKMLARSVADLDVPSGKRDREALKARVRRTVGQDPTDASARFRDGMATEQDLVLLVGYRVVGEKDLLSGRVASPGGTGAAEEWKRRPVRSGTLPPRQPGVVFREIG